MVLRGNREFELSKELPNIGWRLKRKSFLSKWKKDPKQELLLSWTECGPDLLLKQMDLVTVLKSISSIIVSFSERNRQLLNLNKYNSIYTILIFV